MVLTGEGADEVFAGYDIFKEAAVRRFCARNPGSRIRPHLFRKLYPYLPGLKQQSPDYLAAFFGTGLDRIDDPLVQPWTAPARHVGGEDVLFGRFAGASSMAMTRPPISPRTCRRNSRAGIRCTRRSISKPLSCCRAISCRARATAWPWRMASKGRFPFLDHRLVEFAARIPTGLKLKGLTEKHILREATKDLLPASIAKRTKQPYRAPDSQSFSGEDAPAYVAAALAPNAVADCGLFNPKAVAKLHDKCRRQGISGFRDNAAFIGVLSSQLWCHAFAAGGTIRASHAA